MQPLRSTRLAALAGLQRVEHVFDGVFGSRLNPWRNFGALGILFFFMLVASGVVLYAVLDTSATGAYRSIDELSRTPWTTGSVLRGLHRYAADAFVVVMLLHLLREALNGRYRGFRRFSWLTGVPLLLLAFTSAIGGFWLNWDQLGQFSAQATAEWLDRLPVFASPLARNFLSASAVNDRLFSLFVFVHIGVPLLLVFGLWFHIQRIARAAVFPPPPLALGSAATLVVLALAAPVVSQAPADLALAPTVLAYDWLLLFVHPLSEATSAGFVWTLLAVALVLLFGLPSLRQNAPAPAAVVDAANCNGCRRCFDDCPYGAVTMVPHPLRPWRPMAQVNSAQCASCGICVGACPSSTPLRTAAELVTGIDMPSAPVGALRSHLASGLAAIEGSPRKIVAFGCDHGADVTRIAGPDVATFSLLCAAQLPPSFVDYALRDGADGVLVSGCAENACEFRLGQRWAADRLQGARDPHLRDGVKRDRLVLVWAGAGDESALRAALQALRQRLAATAQPAAAGDG